MEHREEFLNSCLESLGSGINRVKSKPMRASTGRDKSSHRKGQSTSSRASGLAPTTESLSRGTKGEVESLSGGEGGSKTATGALRSDEKSGDPLEFVQGPSVSTGDHGIGEEQAGYHAPEASDQAGERDVDPLDEMFHLKSDEGDETPRNWGQSESSEARETRAEVETAFDFLNRDVPHSDGEGRHNQEKHKESQGDAHLQEATSGNGEGLDGSGGNETSFLDAFITSGVSSMLGKSGQGGAANFLGDDEPVAESEVNARPVQNGNDNAVPDLEEFVSATVPPSESKGNSAGDEIGDGGSASASNADVNAREGEADANLFDDFGGKNSPSQERADDVPDEADDFLGESLPQKRAPRSFGEGAREGEEAVGKAGEENSDGDADLLGVNSAAGKDDLLHKGGSEHEGANDIDELFNDPPAPKREDDADARNMESNAGAVNGEKGRSARVERAWQQYKENERRREFEMNERQEAAQEFEEMLSQWNNGNIRTMLSGLHDILWEGSGWKAVGMGDLIAPDAVKKKFYRAQLVVHPDKVAQFGGGPRRQYLASNIFHALQEAYHEFERKEMGA